MEPTRKQSIFFSIPIEIRCEIYRHCIPFLQEQRDLKRLYNPDEQKVKVSIPSLLLVCKAIHNEATPIFLSFATVFLGMEARWAIRSANPLYLPLVRDLQIQLKSDYWPSHYGLDEFTERCGKDLRDLRVVHIHYTKPRICFCNECSVWYLPPRRWHKTDLASLNELLASNDNLDVVKVSGHYDKEWYRNLQNAMKERKRVPKTLLFSDEEAMRALDT